MPQLNWTGAGEARLTVGAETGWQKRAAKRTVYPIIVVVVLEHAVVGQELLIQVQRTHEVLLVMVTVVRVRNRRVMVEVGMVRMVR